MNVLMDEQQYYKDRISSATWKLRQPQLSAEDDRIYGHGLIMRDRSQLSLLWIHMINLTKIVGQARIWLVKNKTKHTVVLT